MPIYSDGGPKMPLQGPGDHWVHPHCLADDSVKEGQILTRFQIDVARVWISVKQFLAEFALYIRMSSERPSDKCASVGGC